ncbi:Protein-disulfide isomerase [Nocardioides terrae]|uniref:Protein-disulfide isomerase n=1 Tax=Nocardioides terrae TaxID=574651 RepID=A0A1I1MM39_9ACTN|nr:thioredoxin domain-containing protein [Nocardioides terrae]SFC84238.1 Protein-disulfide isomerase [Nocardioides terrae]
MSKRSSAEARAERAAAALAEQRRQERRRTMLSIIGVVVAMAVIVVGGFLISQRNGGGPSKEAGSTPAAGTTSVTIGSADAPHKVVIWEDFLCPFCGELEKRTSDRLAAAAASGKVQVTYRPFNLLDTDYSQQSLEVFAATQRIAGDDVAKKLHDVLYAQQPDESAPDDWPSQDDLVDVAVKAGADRTKVQDAIDNGDATTWADASTQAAADAGVRSTPTVLLDGSEVTGRTVDDIAASLLQSVGA